MYSIYIEYYLYIYIYFTCKLVRISLYFLNYWAENPQQSEQSLTTKSVLLIFSFFLFYLYLYNYSHNPHIWDFCEELIPCCLTECIVSVKAPDLVFCQSCHKKNTAYSFSRLAVNDITSFQLLSCHVLHLPKGFALLNKASVKAVPDY